MLDGYVHARPLILEPANVRAQYPTRRAPRTKPFQHYAPAEPAPPTEEELRLASSDLDDCGEIWIQELSDYVLETQKRNKQVDLWFMDSCVVRSITFF